MTDPDDGFTQGPQASCQAGLGLDGLPGFTCLDLHRAIVNIPILRLGIEFRH